MCPEYDETKDVHVMYTLMYGRMLVDMCCYLVIP